MSALSRPRFITGFTRSRSSKSPFTAPSGESIGTMNKVGCALKLDPAPLSRRGYPPCKPGCFDARPSPLAYSPGMPDARLRLSFEEPLRLLAALADLHDLGSEGFE